MILFSISSSVPDKSMSSLSSSFKRLRRQPQPIEKNSPKLCPWSAGRLYREGWRRTGPEPLERGRKRRHRFIRNARRALRAFRINRCLLFLPRSSGSGPVRRQPSRYKRPALQGHSFGLFFSIGWGCLLSRLNEEEREDIDLSGTLEEIEKRIIQKIYAEEGNNQTRTAERLGINRTTLWRKLKSSHW